jgi:hypothetical protein
VLLGYAVGGPISPSRQAIDICGGRWRSADTYYLISGALVSGSRVDQGKIPSGTVIFYKS